MLPQCNVDKVISNCSIGDSYISVDGGSLKVSGLFPSTFSKKPDYLWF